MTSIDLYDELVQDMRQSDLATERQSRKSIANNKTDQFEILVKQCRALVQDVKISNGDIIRQKNRLVTNTSPQEQKNIIARIKKICDQNYGKLTNLRQNLIEAGKIIEVVKKEKPDEPQTYSKIYRKQHLSEEVNRVLNQTLSIQQLVENYPIQRNQQRIRNILPNASQEEIKNLASTTDGMKLAVTQRMQGKVSKQWEYTYKDIMSKKEGLKVLESSIEENLRLMKEVSMLVQQQGEMIDNILKNVIEAKDYVVKAEAILKKEKEMHKTSRKKICCIIFLSLAILALILTPIIIKMVKSKSSSATPSDNTNNSTTNSTIV